LLTGTEKNAQGQTIAKRQYVYDRLDLLAELDGAANLLAAYTRGPGIYDPLIVRYDGVNHIPCSRPPVGACDIKGGFELSLSIFPCMGGFQTSHKARHRLGSGRSFLSFHSLVDTCQQNRAEYGPKTSSPTLMSQAPPVDMCCRQVVK
jgi:hypothetical protein